MCRKSSTLIVNVPYKHLIVNIKLKHINIINSLFVNMEMDVNLKGLNPKIINDIYLDVEVEESMNQCRINLRIEDNCVLDLNDI